MRQHNQNGNDQAQSFSSDSLLYTIYRHHHGLNHEQALAKIEATRTRTLSARAA